MLLKMFFSVGMVVYICNSSTWEAEAGGFEFETT
jgi:hypothetical protein